MAHEHMNAKMDTRLSEAYRTWSAHPELSPDAGMSVTLTYEGDIGAIEALGFQTHSTSGTGNPALGIVKFRDIPKLAASPGVLLMAAGRRRKKRLDTAVRDIRARAAAPVTGSPVDGVWHADVASGALTHINKATGKGVIV